MAATLTQERFSGPEWLFERKFDGIRLLAFKRDDEVTLLSRNRLPQQLPAVAAAIRALPSRTLVLDGELTWHGGLAYHVFDLLWIDGTSTTTLPLDTRLARLRALPFTSPLRHVDALEGPSPWEQACREGWEGVVAKRRDSPYEHKRSKHWLKMKCELAQSFVVGGFTDPQGSRVGLGALLVGYFDDSDLVFAGKVGTGFDAPLLQRLRTSLDARELEASPFTRATGLPRVRVHWVRPEIVVRAAFIEWTAHGKLRHSRLLDVLPDADASSVVRTT